MISGLKSLIYIPIISRVLRFIFKPFVVTNKIYNWLIIRLKLNGGKVKYYNQELIFPKNVGVIISSRIFWKGESGFEPLIGKCMTVLLPKTELFFDIGSNFGFYSVWAQKINPNIHTECFEPVNHLYLDNKKFHQVNSVRNYNLHNLAVGQKDMYSEILIPNQKLRYLITSATLSSEFAKYKEFETITQEVKVVRLDSIMEDFNDNLKKKSYNSILKIDVEGFEFSVLEGGKKFISEYRPIIFIEIFFSKENINNINSINNFLQEVDYKIFAFSSLGLILLNENDFFQYEGDRNFLISPTEKISVFRNLIPFNQLNELIY